MELSNFSISNLAVLIFIYLLHASYFCFLTSVYQYILYTLCVEIRIDILKLFTQLTRNNQS